MKNRTQSFTSVSFASDHHASHSRHLRRAATVSENAAAEPVDTDSDPSVRAGKDLLELCREIAGLLLKRYLVADTAAEVRAELTAELKARLSCTDRQAQALITLALEIIHLKSYGEYRCSAARLEKLIAIAGGVSR